MAASQELDLQGLERASLLAAGIVAAMVDDRPVVGVDFEDRSHAGNLTPEVTLPEDFRYSRQDLCSEAIDMPVSFRGKKLHGRKTRRHCHRVRGKCSALR